MGVRELLMLIYGAVWAIVVILTAWRTGDVPAQLWAGLGVGEGALMALYRTEDALRRRSGSGHPDDGDDE
jgi:hypothetical protein